MILLFRPHRLGFVQSRVSRLLIPVTRRLVLPVIARRDARGPQSAARTCCLRTGRTGRKKGVFFGYFLCTSKERDPRYSIAEALAPKATTTRTARHLDKNERSCYFPKMLSSTATNKGAATREAVVERALIIARKEGFEGLTIGGIATAVGMSKSGVFAHFGSREDLQLAVLDAAAQGFTESVFLPAIREKRGLPRLRAIMRNWVSWLRNAGGGCPMISAAIEYDDRAGPIRDRVVEYQTK